MRPYIELIIIAVAIVFAAVVFSTARADDRLEHCLDLASVYQMAATLRDANAPPAAILVQVRAYSRTSEAERQLAVDHVMANPYQSAGAAFKAALVKCRYAKDGQKP